VLVSVVTVQEFRFGEDLVAAIALVHRPVVGVNVPFEVVHAVNDLAAQFAHDRSGP
jgi:hypothetical protein